jgi:hypothetical protein
MSKIEVNQISSQCGSTLTVGQSGDTVTLASGATQTGFGRTGTVDWDTTAKTASFTAVSGNGYFVNTTSGAITVTLPATPSAGDIVAVSDYAGTASTNNITIARNGSNINGAAADLTIVFENSAVTLVYADGTQGWKATDTSSLSDIELQPTYIIATGGTVTCCGDYKIHTFTGPGTFTVCSVGNPAGSDSVDYMVVAGGGGSTANQRAGGGGAGGFRLSNSTCMPAPLTSPLANPTGITVAATAYPITVGAGGIGGTPGPAGSFASGSGSNSIFSSITSAGGGYGYAEEPSINVTATGGPGGSGGGGMASAPPGPASANPSLGGSGNTPPVSPSQGNTGGGGFDGRITNTQGGGGGGAGAAGGNASSGNGGLGGAGSFVVGSGFAGCNGTPGPVCGAKYFAGGGGGATDNEAPEVFPGGVGGGGNGGNGGNNGTANTGGGGGSGASPVAPNGSAGGSGIVIIRYKFQ